MKHANKYVGKVRSLILDSTTSGSSPDEIALALDIDRIHVPFLVRMAKKKCCITSVRDDRTVRYYGDEYAPNLVPVTYRDVIEAMKELGTATIDQLCEYFSNDERSVIRQCASHAVRAGYIYRVERGVYSYEKVDERLPYAKMAINEIVENGYVTPEVLMLLHGISYEQSMTAIQCARESGLDLVRKNIFVLKDGDYA